MSDAKEHAHELIDRLPPTQLSALVGLLEAMLDPVVNRIVWIEPARRAVLPIPSRII